MTDKEKVKALVDEQPDDASYDEIVRELAFERMIDSSLKDARQGRVVSNEEIGRRIVSWQK